MHIFFVYMTLNKRVCVCCLTDQAYLLTRTCFETEVKGNSEMAHWPAKTNNLVPRTLINYIK